MSEHTTPHSPEQQTSTRGERFKRFLGSTADKLFAKVVASEKRGHEEQAAQSYESLYAAAKGVNRQAAEAIKDITEGFMPNANLAPKEIKGAEGSSAAWTAMVAFTEQRQGSPYSHIDSQIKPSLNFGGKEIPVSQLALEVRRDISKLGEVGDPYTELFINGSMSSEATPDSTKWMIRVGADGEVVSAATNRKSESPNALSPVDPLEVQGLGDMMHQLHFAIWEARTANEQGVEN